MSSQSGIKYEVRQLKTLLGKLQLEYSSCNITADEALDLTVEEHNYLPKSRIG
jgi:hypothetical protein